MPTLDLGGAGGPGVAAVRTMGVCGGDGKQVIIEVLSESTESFERLRRPPVRGKKFQYYRTLPSLQDYILISSQEYLTTVPIPPSPPTAPPATPQ
ncbi:Uma2 family endonuclease [[Phormidium] sp. ETS-05]|uniref:Uma2 family endonuclease n=1 Tax=[Phormidium] sp. ETS-05 TaxID=222819 RepID=UPI0018EEE3B1|nr:Uma2 family endonuclease [[Phormidium] sp. ETS-05]